MITDFGGLKIMPELKIIYEKSANFDEYMRSGLMKETLGEIKISAEDITPLLRTLNNNFKTSLNTQKSSDVELFIWLAHDELLSEEKIVSFDITFNNNYNFEKNLSLVNQIIHSINAHAGNVYWVKVTRDCEVDRDRVEQFLNGLKNGDVFENILENVSKLCVIDSETYTSNTKIAKMIDEYEEILFKELVNKKIRVNGKGGALREVQGDCGRYGFFE
jgi:hypothetical protein